MKSKVNIIGRIKAVSASDAKGVKKKSFPQESWLKISVCWEMPMQENGTAR